ncbi:hypothetical protein ABW20_dc0103885 [Dactylellina cionopaga]|nr:hypothetical protein ABW20_dc0103885 [Dactylellina cionopaga]
MCILLWTTACRDQGFPLILLSNRDEFVHRPTQTAGPWDLGGACVYGGRDLARVENGTWLGINRGGRFAALTNIREASSAAAVGPVSRGAVVSSFLTSPEIKIESWTNDLEKEKLPGLGIEIGKVGGFSMLCGQFTRASDKKVKIESFGVVSNGGSKAHTKKLDLLDSSVRRTYGLSNTTFTEPWPKVLGGEQLLHQLVEEIQRNGLNDQEISKKALEILSNDTLSSEKGWEQLRNKVDLLKNSIFIPLFNTARQVELGNVQPEKLTAQTSTPAPHLHSHYGTQKQSVIIVHDSGKVRYVERTLFDWLQGKASEDNNTVDMTFSLEI